MRLYVSMTPLQSSRSTIIVDHMKISLKTNKCSPRASSTILGSFIDGCRQMNRLQKYFVQFHHRE